MQPGKEKVCRSLHFHMKVHHPRKLRQELNRGHGGRAYLARPASFIQPGAISLGMAPPTVSRALPHQSLTNKILYRFDHRSI